MARKIEIKCDLCGEILGEEIGHFDYIVTIECNSDAISNHELELCSNCGDRLKRFLKLGG